MATRIGRPSRRRLRFAGGVLLVLAAGGAVLWWIGHGHQVPVPLDPTTGGVPTTSLSPPLPDVAGPVGDGPAVTADGCLGGTDPVAAQAAATLDPPGAAAFALTVARWGWQYPTDPHAAAVIPQIIAPALAADQLDRLTADSTARARAGFVRSASTPGGADQWRVTAQDGTTITLNLGIYLQNEMATGASQPVHAYVSMTLDSAAGHWVITGNPHDDPGDRWASIPDHPWHPFVGVC